ncbi:hypothetical protein, partial [Salmonella enterica]|uniref:hypothetical protein n=1 Tax=Salmonella enterica TaxID=28901 RepID=UPI0022B63B58|nr:hypothetical protein [Salmonella enterica]
MGGTSSEREVSLDSGRNVLEALRARGWRFYTFIGAGGCRFMCSWDLQPETVEALAADMRAVCAA